MRPQLGARLLGMSVVSVAEIKRGAIAARWSDPRIQELEDQLRKYIVLPVDDGIAEEWARTRARCDRLGRRKSDNDLWVAVTAKRYGLPLATLDHDQYDIPGLTVIREDGSEIRVPE